MILLPRLGVDLGPDVWNYSALGVFFRFQVSDFDPRFGFFSLCHFIFPSYLFWVVSRCCSVTPKGKRPPLTSFSGIKSSRRINLSFVRLRVLIPDSVAGAFFLSFGVFTLLSPDISIRAKSPPAGIKAGMLAMFIV
jgi:hypothetical protein